MKSSNNVLALTLLMTAQPFVAAAQFVDSGVSIPGGIYRSIAWADDDIDGDYDFFHSGVLGDDNSAMYRNGGDGTFVQISLDTIGQYQHGSAQWADFDYDTDLDLLLGTSGSGASSGIYLDAINHENHGFISSREGVWGDYDSDGDLDVVWVAQDFNIYRTVIYRNDKSEGFADIEADIPGINFPSALWEDFDGDGDLDLLLSGGSSSPETLYYRNDGDDTFVLETSGLPAAGQGSLDAGDYDNDGDLDVLLTGYVSPDNHLADIYQNDGTGHFTGISADLAPVYGSSARWGDFDNDGDLDIVLCGNGQGRLTFIYTNNGDSTFTEAQSLRAAAWSSATYADYDNDSDLDVLIVGQDNQLDNHATLYRNAVAATNLPPAAPGGLTVEFDSEGAILQWKAPTDDHTPAAGLAYNLYVGTTPGGSEIISAMADTATGFRRVRDNKLLIHNTERKLTGLIPETTYYWSVQAVDTAFSGSQFSEEATFVAPAVSGVTAARDWQVYE